MHDQSHSLQATTINAISTSLTASTTQRSELQRYLTTLGPDKLIQGRVTALMEAITERDFTYHGRQY